MMLNMANPQPGKGITYKKITHFAQRAIVLKMKCNGILYACFKKKKIMSVTLTEFHLNLGWLGAWWRRSNASGISALFHHKEGTSAFLQVHITREE